MTTPDPLHDTGTFYNAIADDYDEHFRDVLDGMPLERAMLAGFAELVRGDQGPVADLGCGPGRVTAHLGGLGGVLPIRLGSHALVCVPSALRAWGDPMSAALSSVTNAPR